MNKQRRGELTKAAELLQQALSIIADCKGEEEECFENLPEGLQGSEKGQAMEEHISNMDCAISEIESSIEAIELCLEQ